MNMCTSAIEKIRISRFGPFDGSYDLSFVPGINVIVGDNGTGKSQLLKLLYSCTQVLQDEGFEHTKTAIQRRIAEKLVGVFCPDSFGRLVTRQQERAKTEVMFVFCQVGVLVFVINFFRFCAWGVPAGVICC